MPDNGTPYRPEGAMTKDEVPALWRATSSWQARGVPAEVDLSGVHDVDASAVALLLEWMAWAQERGESIRFRNAPEGLRTIAALSQVDDLLGLKEAETE
jgi:ABC-type transporter Mla MlaB component